MKKNIVIVVVLAILVVISIVQAVQLNGLRAKVSEVGTISGGTSSQKTVVGSSGGSSGQGAAIPSNIQNLPQMVGGC